MAFRFQSASCVVAGTFNMYVVQPAWLVEVGILQEGTPVTIGSKLDEPGFLFSSPKLPVKWFIAPNRIMLDTESPTANCGDTIAKVLNALPWTPLSGLGNNTTYTAPATEYASLAENLRNALEPPSGYGLAQRSFHYAATQESRIFNLQLSITQEEIELAINVHTDLQAGVSFRIGRTRNFSFNISSRWTSIMATATPSRRKGSSSLLFLVGRGSSTVTTATPTEHRDSTESPKQAAMKTWLVAGHYDPGFVDAAESELDRLSKLTKNWDHEGAPPINREIIEAARRFIKALPENLACRPRVVPMSPGNLQFEWHHGPKVLELEIEDPQTIHFLKWDPDRDIEEEDTFPVTDLDSAVELIQWFMSGTLT